MSEFTVTDEHLKLLRAAYIGWDDCEFGAPAIDCKRPYGTSNVLLGIAEILDADVIADMGDGQREDYVDANADRYTELHRETQTVLQIAVSTGEFRTGLYRKASYTSGWELVR